MRPTTDRRRQVSEWFGVLLAIVSSSLGGTAAAITRYLVGSADPLTLAILRWGIGLCVVVPVALVLRVRWPQRSDLPMSQHSDCVFSACSSSSTTSPSATR